jgi:Glycosyl transferase family 2
VRLLAAAPVRDEMEHLPALLRNLKPHVDGIVVYDDASSDGSGEWLAARPEVLEVVRGGAGRSPWYERKALRALVGSALRHQADWILWIDADARVERRFRTRAERVIARGDRQGFSAYSVVLRELWDSRDTYRCDGIWGDKRRVWLFRAIADHVFDDKPVHTTKAPLQAGVRGTFPRADLWIYHLRMITPANREARRRKYEALDPEARWQPGLGYAYLTDERDLELRKVPRSRGFLE